MFADCQISGCARAPFARVRFEYRILLLALFLVAPRSMTAQDSSESQAPDKIRGTVINQLTHEPIGRALVYSPDNRFATVTDSDGHFEFTVPKPTETGANRGPVSYPVAYSGPIGPNALMARKPGFLEDPNTLQQHAAFAGSDLTISLLPEAIILGHVMASNSDPASNVSVQLFRRDVQDGMLRWHPAGMSRTNSSGEFRFAELQPGTYKVMTQELLDQDPEINKPRGQAYGFPPVCFPGVPDLASGASIDLAAGEKFQADIPLARQPYFQVSLPVVNTETGGGINVAVLAQGHPGPGYSLGYNSGTHKVEGLLPNGTYLVELNSFGPPPAHGLASFVVANKAVESPSIPLALNGLIPIEVHEEFTSTDWNGSATYNIHGQAVHVQRGPRVYLNLWLEPADDFLQRGGASLRPPVSSGDEPLVIENVQPGRYWVRINTGRGYVQSLTSGGVDLVHQPLVVTSASHAPIEVTMRDDFATLDGTVMGLDPANTHETAGLSKATVAIGPSRVNDAAAYIYCIPLPDSSGQFREFWASPDGKFTLPGMPAGSYRVLAFAHPHRNLPFRDPQAMQAYQDQGVVVRLAPGQTEHVQLQLISGD